MLPRVEIIISNGGLGGSAATNDGVIGIIGTGGAGLANLPLGTPTLVTSIEDVQALGLNEQYDSDNDLNIYAQLSGIFTQVASAQVWLMIVPETESMEDVCDPASTNHYASQLLDAAGGAIRLLGVCRRPASDYSPEVTKGIDPDVLAAIVKAEALAKQREAVVEPLLVVIEARGYDGDPGALEDITGLGANHVAAVISNSVGDDSADVGLLLGTLARDQVMRKIGRVKSGALPIGDGFFSDGTAVTRTLAEAVDAKGWIVYCTYPQRAGYYYGNDHTAADAGDDFSSIVNRRVINKAIQVTYDTYVGELNDEVEVTKDGLIHPSVITYFEQKIKSAIDAQMTSNGEISERSVYIDPAQDVIGTGRLDIVLSIIPVGYTKEISVSLGFINPSNS